MIWIVELAAPEADALGVTEARLVTWLGVRRCLIEADRESAERVSQSASVTSIQEAPDDLYVDPATRTVWEVLDQGTVIRLVGYVPP